MNPAAGTAASVLVWPRWQRALHWALAASVLAALFTHRGGALHEAAGYAALALALLRILLGVVGPAAARFAAFVRGPRATWGYARALLQGREARHMNHNPLGAAMVLALLALSAVGGASGVLYTTDAYWGEAWLIAVHAISSWALAPLLALHLAGVAHASRRHHENLVAAMWHGRKAQAGGPMSSPTSPPAPSPSAPSRRP